MSEQDKSSNIIQVTQQKEINDLLDNNYTLCVDFWAPWCGPCLKFAEVFDEAAFELSDTPNSIKFIKVNIDQATAIATEYEINSIPTVLLLKKDQPPKKRVGSMTKNELVEFIKQQQAQN